MPFNLQAATERPNQTIHAAAVTHDNAAQIASCCDMAEDNEVVIVAVAHDHAFRSMLTVQRSDLVKTILRFDDGGWTLTFSPGATIEEIEERCHAMARLAFRRWETTRRWASKHR